jgi:DNA-binding IclR family transcriptional regulator
MSERDGEAIRRTLKMLVAIVSFRGHWFSVTELSAKVGLAKSTTHRYMQVLVEEHILDYEPATQKYQAMTSKR